MASAARLKPGGLESQGGPEAVSWGPGTQEVVEGGAENVSKMLSF